MSALQKKTVEEAINALNNFSSEYHDAIHAIAAPLGEVRRTLSGEFRTYLQRDYANLFDFAAFLSEKEHTASRDAIRPFLTSVAEEEQEAMKNGKGAIQEASEQWNEWVRSGLRDEIFLPWTESLWASIFAEKDGKRTNVEMDKSLLEAVTSVTQVSKTFMPEANQDTITLEEIRQALTRLGDINMWPSSGLRNAYINFGKAKIGSAIRDIRQSLLENRQKETLSPGGVIFDPETLPGAKREKQALKGKDTNDATEHAPAKETSKPYRLGKLIRVGKRDQIEVMTEEEVEEHIQKQAASIARKEPTLGEDIGRLYDAVLQGQDTTGINIIKSIHITVDNKRLVVKSFDPRKRIGIALTHDTAYSLRLIFAMDRNNQVVVVDGKELGLYRHEDYISKFHMRYEN